MSDVMTFPETVEEFMEKYKVVDTEKVYTNGIELVPIYRMKQWFEHLPAVPQEMSAGEYLAAEQRMCFDENIGKRNCVNCPLSSSINPLGINCGDYTRQHPDEAVAIVKKWARENPEEGENNE